ncbi:hypothetical protein ACR6HW_07940 [Fusibacter sp. JL298sf-3]
MKIYENIGVLKLNGATDDLLKDIHEISNCGMVILTEAQQAKIAHVTFKNIGSQLVVPDDVDVIMRNGNFELTQSFLKSQTGPFALLINGTIVVDKDVSISELNALKKALVNGQLYVPEHLDATINRVTMINGDVMPYPSEALLFTERVVLNDSFMYGIPAGTPLCFNTLDLSGDFSRTLFEKTLSKVTVLNELIVRQEDIEWLAPYIERFPQVKKHILKPGYHYYENLTLEDNTLYHLKGDQLFIKDKLVVKCAPEKLKEKVKKVICSTLKTYPDSVEDLMPIIEKVDKVQSLYRNTTANYNVLVIGESELAHLETLSYENYGKLTFDDTVQPETFKARVKLLVNYGVIHCPPSLYPLVLEKCVENMGKISKTTDADAADTSDSGERNGHTIVANMGFLDL